MRGRLVFAALLVALAFSAGILAQVEQPAEADPLAELEERVARIEGTLERLAAQPSALTDASVNLRLQRVEATLGRLERQAATGSPRDGGMMTPRMIDSRLRRLESEVARIRR